MPDLTLPGAGESSEGKAGQLPSNAPPVEARGLPAVDRLLDSTPLKALALVHGLIQVKRAVQQVLAEHRAATLAGASTPALDLLMAQVQSRVAQVTTPRLRAVFNLSGTVIHTNLGRSLLAEEAIDAVGVAMRNFVALEYNINTGKRGDRDDVVEQLLCDLTGAEAATVVNNNAAAVLLSLKALAARKEVIISRGELVEIGGAFRMPDIMKAAGCKLVEVGTTNRTHARDYEGACGSKTALIVKAHWSNYAITGFTATVDDATLAQIAHQRNLPYMVDLGAGALVDLSAMACHASRCRGIAGRGRRRRHVLGDKLLGGPQGG